MTLRPRQLDSERGLTLTELVIVAAIASMVMAGLVTFYMNSQATWSDGFTQAIAQREATSVIEDISRHVRQSAQAQWTVGGTDAQLDLFDATDLINPAYSYRWSIGAGADSLIRGGPYDGGGAWQSRGPLATSLVEQFAVTHDAVLVDVVLQLRSAQAERVEVATRIKMNNR